jgi:hypothetical protein
MSTKDIAKDSETSSKKVAWLKYLFSLRLIACALCSNEHTLPKPDALPDVELITPSH